MSSSKLKTGEIICDKFKVIDEIGQGGFGDVYLAENCTDKKKVVLKVDKDPSSKYLKNEAKVYKQVGGKYGFGKLIFAGRTNSDHGMIVMNKLGSSLHEICDKTKFGLKIKTVAMIGIAMTYNLQKLHLKGFVHRDVKPNNILVGNHDNKKPTSIDCDLFLIDFGNTEKFRADDGYIFQEGEAQSDVAGTILFAPHAWHIRTTQCRRDDFESLAYTLSFLFFKYLPWQNMPTRSLHDLLLIGEAKRNITADTLFNGMNSNMHRFFKYIKSLGFYDEPNYRHIRKIFRTVLKCYNVNNEKDYEWL